MTAFADADGAGPGERVIVASAASAFEAHAMVATLAEAGIEAETLDAAQQGAQVPLGREAARVPVHVAPGDLERARAALASSRSESEEIDWSDVDVGEREDELPLSPAGRMPPAARIAFGVTIAVVVLIAILFVVSLLLLLP